MIDYATGPAGCSDMLRGVVDDDDIAEIGDADNDDLPAENNVELHLSPGIAAAPAPIRLLPHCLLHQTSCRMKRR